MIPPYKVPNLLSLETNTSQSFILSEKYKIAPLLIALMIHAFLSQPLSLSVWHTWLLLLLPRDSKPDDNFFPDISHIFDSLLQLSQNVT